MKHVIIPWSGGIDSTALVLRAVEAGEHRSGRLRMYCVDYGAPYHSAEAAAVIEMSAMVARMPGISEGELEVYFPFVGNLWSMVSGPNAFIPGRNLMIVAHCLSRCVKCSEIDPACDTVEIRLGIINEDTLDEHTPSALAHLSAALTAAYGVAVRVTAPLRDGSKVMVAASLPPEIMDATVSCYETGRCGRCRACFRRFATMLAVSPHAPRRLLEQFESSPVESPAGGYYLEELLRGATDRWPASKRSTILSVFQKAQNGVFGRSAWEFVGHGGLVS